MPKDELQALISEISVIVKKYPMAGLVIAVGIKKGNLFDEAVNVQGDDSYLASLLTNCLRNHVKFRKVIGEAIFLTNVAENKLKDVAKKKPDERN